MYSLPPGFELSSKIYGFFEIKIGNLFWLNVNQNLQNSLIKLKFFGENHDGLTLKAKNSDHSFHSEAKYEIKVPLLNFQQYLEDMAKIKLLIVDKKTENQIGHVIINLLLYVKRKFLFFL